MPAGRGCGGRHTHSMPRGLAIAARAISRIMSSMDVWTKPPCERAGYSENSASRPPGDQNSFCPASTSSTAALNKSAAVASSSTENAGSMPSSVACMRKMREHMPWMVEIHASSTLSAWAAIPSAASVAFTRDLISPAALSVNVMAKTCSMSSKNGAPSAPDPGSKAHAMRWVSVKVFPLPAPADTATGASSVFTQRSWPSLNVEKSIALPPPLRAGDFRTE